MVNGQWSISDYLIFEYSYLFFVNIFIQTITSADTEIRNRSFFEMARILSSKELLKALRELDVFRKATSNLYEKVRAILFLHAGYRFFLIES